MITVLSPDGDLAEAQVFAAAEMERLAGELPDEPDPAPDGQAKVYTAHIDPRDGTPTIQIHFPYADEHLLAATMRREVAHLFGVGGADRVRELDRAIYVPSRLRALQGGRPALLSYPNVVPFPSVEEDQQAAATVLAAYEKARRTVEEDAAATLPVTEAEAVQTALEQLDTARAQIFAEAAAYLDLPGSSRATALDLLTRDVPASQALLRGPRLAALTGALRRVHASRDALVAATGRLDTARRERRAPGPAAQEVTEAAADLATVLSVEALEFPILHRIWRLPTLPSTVQAVPGRNGEPTLLQSDAGRSLTDLKVRIFTSLRSAWAANNRFAARLAANHDHVWRYPPLIGRALDALDIGDPSVAYRAAQDRVETESGMTLTNALCLANAGVATGAAVAVAAPPVLLALAVSGAVLGLVDLAQDYLRRAEQEDACNAVLDPSLAVASEPRYLGLLVGVAFAVLDLKGVGDAFRAVRAADSARTATLLLDVTTP